MLLREGRDDELARRVTEDARLIRPLVGRLWDPQPDVRRRAARAVGIGTGAHRELGLDLARRFMWALNDESATNGVYVIPALGQMGRRAPELMAPFVAPLASVAWDDGLRLEVIRALSAIAEAAPELVREQLPGVAGRIDEDSPEETEALAELRAKLGGSTRR